MNEAPIAAHVEDPLSPVLREVLALFGDELQTLKFPDVDGAALSAQAQGVERLFMVVKQLEQSLQDARKELEDAQEALLQKAWRAVAYARVYADGDPALSARLETLTFPPRTRTARAAVSPMTTTEAPKKRARKNTPAADSSLFAVANEAAEAAEVVEVDVGQAA